MPSDAHFRVVILLAGLLYFAGAGDVHAGEWLVVPRFSLGENYSDNINLTRSNTESDFITRAEPGLSVSGSGRRVDLNLQYNLQSLTYLDTTDNNDINHQLQSDLNIEVVRNIFFLNADASMFQALVTNTGTISNRNYETNNNRTDVLTYGVRPEFRHHFGLWADMSASTQVSDTIAFGSGSSREAGSGNSLDLNTRLTSGRRFTNTSWSLSNTSTVFNNDSGAPSSKRQRWNGTVSRAINRIFRLNGSFGYENNDSSGGGAGDDNGVTWDVGATITPNPRASLTGRYGKRAFGDTKSFDFDYRRRRISISGSYTEDLQTTSDQLRNQQLFPLEDPFGNPVFDPFGASDVDNPLGTLSLSDDVYVSRDFNASVGYVRRRDNFVANVYRTERDRGATTGPEEAIGTVFSWTRNFSRRLSGGVTVTYRSGTSGILEGGNPDLEANPNSEVEVIVVSPSFSYSIGPHTNGQFSYSYMNSDSKDPTNVYTENSLSAALSFAF